jgi:hypothetical protein
MGNTRGTKISKMYLTCIVKNETYDVLRY